MSLKSVLRKVKDNPIGLYIWNEHRELRVKVRKKSIVILRSSIKCI